MMYANPIAMSSTNKPELDNGSTIVMEVYKASLDKNGNPISGKTGIFEKGKIAAIAVMKKRIT